MRPLTKYLSLTTLWVGINFILWNMGEQPRKCDEETCFQKQKWIKGRDVLLNYQNHDYSCVGLPYITCINSEKKNKLHLILGRYCQLVTHEVCHQMIRKYTSFGPSSLLDLMLNLIAREYLNSAIGKLFTKEGKEMNKMWKH